jgi:hypothetical protein
MFCRELNSVCKKKQYVMINKIINLLKNVHKTKTEEKIYLRALFIE